MALLLLVTIGIEHFPRELKSQCLQFYSIWVVIENDLQIPKYATDSKNAVLIFLSHESLLIETLRRLSSGMQLVGSPIKKNAGIKMF